MSENRNDAGVYAQNAPQGFIDKIVSSVRTKIFRKLSCAIDLEALQSILDVGVTSEKERASANFFEKLYTHPERITALSDQDASWMQEEFKGLKFVRGDGRSLPFADESFDMVFSSAVLEHAGNVDRQIAFVAEALRVAKKYVYLTTPNRFHPMEFHTSLPLIHWLPKSIYRFILRTIGKDFYADENNLNLLSKCDLIKIARAAITAAESGGAQAVILNDVKNLDSSLTLRMTNATAPRERERERETRLRGASYSIDRVWFLGFPSNLLLRITKDKE
ncbi:hypothetical protein AGMMS50229_01100 [Campylobacterota bacterium]|nr:hypothetical protein AGMMS50229_01100 [Campylobacterota bacterium]